MAAPIYEFVSEASRGAQKQKHSDSHVNAPMASSSLTSDNSTVPAPPDSDGPSNADTGSKSGAGSSGKKTGFHHVHKPGKRLDRSRRPSITAAESLLRLNQGATGELVGGEDHPDDVSRVLSGTMPTQSSSSLSARGAPAPSPSPPASHRQRLTNSDRQMGGGAQAQSHAAMKPNQSNAHPV